MDHGPYDRSAEVYDVFYESMLDYPTLATAAHGMIQSRLPGAKSLLEVGCGTGLYLAEMSRWYEVAGLDASAEMLRIAAGRVPDVPLHRGDMAAFDLDQTFDAVICMFSSIGYVVTLERFQAAIQCFADHLVPGGVLILEPWLRPEVWQEGRVDAKAVTGDDIAVSRSTSSIREGRKVTMRMAFAVSRPGGDVETYTEEHPTALFTHEEHESALRSAGIEFDYDPEGLLGRGRYVGVKSIVV